MDQACVENLNVVDLVVVVIVAVIIRLQAPLLPTRQQHLLRLEASISLVV